MALPSKSTIRGLFTAVRRAEAGEVERVLETYPHLLEAANHWDGRTLLYHAACLGQKAMVRMLLDRGAGVDTETRDGVIPLYAAANSGHAEVVSLLLERGADLARTSGPVNFKWTALMGACHAGHLVVTRMLLQRLRGEGLGATDVEGYTTLHLACKTRRPEVTRALLLAGADPAIKGGPYRRTPKQMAVSVRSRACEKVFEWWEVELDRAYALHRARRLYDDSTNRQQAPGGPVPPYLRARVERSEPLPHVDLAPGMSGRKRGTAMCNIEERDTMLSYAIQDLGHELFIELLEGFRS